MTVHRVKMCACGHEEAHHEGKKGRCVYGHGTTTGGCTCEGFHRRSRSPSTLITDGDAPPLNAQHELADAFKDAGAALMRIGRLLSIATPRIETPAPKSTTRVVAPPNPRAKTDHRRGQSAVAPRGLPKMPFALLSIIAARAPKPTTSKQLTLLTGYAHSGSFTEAIALLRREGLITSATPYEVTEQGLRVAGPLEPVPSGRALLKYWLTKLSTMPSTLLRVVEEARPSELTREQLAELAGYALSGSFTTAVAELRALDLIEPRSYRLTKEFSDAIGGRS